MATNINDIDVMATDTGGGMVFYYQGQPFTGIIEEFFYSDPTLLATEIQCINGSINGFIKEYFLNGQMKREYFKKFNRIYGDYKEWDENGTLVLHSVFNNDGDLIQRVI